MGSRCLSDSSVFCHDLIHVKLFKDLVFFCSVDAREVFVETILNTKTVRAPISVINDVISEFLQSGAPVTWRSWPISSDLQVTENKTAVLENLTCNHLSS